ncbi:MAG: hypothetical protein J0J15_28030, partial [Mesorhizobium sp.]|nr:hypothetical protein [Mesorhizobium sp.]
VLPEFREYERFSTTVINTYVGPRMGRYLEGFLARLTGLGVPVPPYTVHSNGGLMSVSTVRAFPVRTCLSGPAAGVVGAAEVGTAAGFPDVVTFDAGGTSTDVSLIAGGVPAFATSRLVADYPVRMPMVDVHVIGAGGGSIAWIDDAGALKVGPHSAGADPGPVAYGRGGQRAGELGAIERLARLYWYTVEFGLLRGADGLQIYGAGIVSSFSESIFALDDPSPNRIAFDLRRVMRTLYRIDDFQQTYFVIDSFEDLLRQTVESDFAPLYRALQGANDIGAADVLDSDRVDHRGTQAYAHAKALSAGKHNA